MTKDCKFSKNSLRTLFIALLLILGIPLMTTLFGCNENQNLSPEKAKSTNRKAAVVDSNWLAPADGIIPAGKLGEEIRYGKQLVIHTSLFLGPKGKVAAISNGMNCQNCHLAAGTKPYAFNFSAVKSTYPQIRNRSGTLVSIGERINGCFKRSLNGRSLETAGKEMKAMIAYIEWVGSKVPRGVKPGNAGVIKLKYLSRAADPEKGKVVYATCEACHGKEGKGHLNDDGTEYIFPPLWGKHSYNDGAGLERLSNFAGFVKNNMPFGTTYKHPVLTDEEAWDIAAYVDSQRRPHKDQSKDYILSGKKPIDSPYGPYKDTFSERQHKYGPYPPILLAKNKKTAIR